MSPERIPIFPLPNVVLFPGISTPLHLFEPRYRQMAEHALAGERRIAMVTVRPDQVAAMAGDPEVFPIGCAGIISQSEKLRDGRYNIIVLGSHRIRIVDEPPREPDQLYRVARVERLEDAFDSKDAEHVGALRTRVIALVSELVRSDAPDEPLEITPSMFEALDDAAFVNSLANGLPFPPPEKQNLLEADSIPERLERLEGLLAFLRAERDSLRSPSSGVLH